MPINWNLPKSKNVAPPPKLKILDGEFFEGQSVTVSIDGRIVQRKVRYSSTAGDLFIQYKNKMYFLYEFE